jgi:hypothetical protein
MTNNTPDLTATFARIFKLEGDCRLEQAAVECGIDYGTRARAARRVKEARARLYAAMEELNIDQLRAYGAYRAAALAE